MAYWRNYRKFSVEACTVAHEESSDEETLNGTQNFVHGISTENSPATSENEVLVSTDSSSGDEAMPECKSENDLKTHRIKLLCISCDVPARGFLKVIVGHTGYFSCERCEIRGTWEGRVVFNSADISTLRTEEDFAKCSYKNHQKGRTPLINYGISCINDFALDYMHLVCLGVMKRILHSLKNGPRHCKLSSG